MLFSLREHGLYVFVGLDHFSGNQTVPGLILAQEVSSIVVLFTSYLIHMCFVTCLWQGATNTSSDVQTVVMVKLLPGGRSSFGPNKT